MDYGNIFKLAAMNTLLGMGTVFIVLIFISFIISLFKYIAPKAPKAAPAAPAPEPEVPEVQEEEADLTPDNGELIAVIMAALKASMESAAGTEINPADYVVRSIRRR